MHFNHKDSKIHFAVYFSDSSNFNAWLPSFGAEAHWVLLVIASSVADSSLWNEPFHTYGDEPVGSITSFNSQLNFPHSIEILCLGKKSNSRAQITCLSRRLGAFHYSAAQLFLMPDLGTMRHRAWGFNGNVWTMSAKNVSTQMTHRAWNNYS